jgi:hypothetical protein
MRDNFSSKTKRTLADRVAWKCSFSGCSQVTIGPNVAQDKSTNLGEAAHIFAASEDGPRYNPNMTPVERKSIENGIWMCRHHARLIDNDFFNYSAATLQQWKLIAEESAYKNITKIGSNHPNHPYTLVAIDNDIVFEGVWLSAKNDNWKFEINKFIIGSIELMIDKSTSRNNSGSFVVVESQGDGRILKEPLSWELANNKYIISLIVRDKSIRKSPQSIVSGVAIGIDGEIIIENRTMKIIKGVDYAIQLVRICLSVGFGEIREVPTIGTNLSTYYWKFRNNLNQLGKLAKLDITRLISIPEIANNDSSIPTLNFINRIIDVEILNNGILNNDKIAIKLKLEWGDGTYWEDTININVKNLASCV